MTNEIVTIRDIECLQEQFNKNYNDNKIIIIQEDFYKQHEKELKELMNKSPLVNIAIAPLEAGIIALTMDTNLIGGFIND